VQKTTTTLTAVCPSTKRPLGGGWQITSGIASGNVNFTVIATQPNTAANGWSVTIQNNGATDLGASIFATCMVSAS